MKFFIRGGRPLRGAVVVDGSKNATLPILAATLLTDREVVLHRVPALKDVQTLIEILKHSGKSIEPLGEGSYRIRSTGQLLGKVPHTLVHKMRASFLVLGPLLARVGEVEISLPGGCAIGLRPVDLHLRGLQAMGAELTLKSNSVAARTDRLRAAEIHLSYPSVGATEHLLMTAALVPGRTVIRNPAQEPEVDDLIAFLSKLGARIERSSTCIEVKGRSELGGAEHTVIPDRICAGTYLIAAALTGGEVKVSCNPWHLHPLVAKLKEMGVEIEEEPAGLVVSCKGHPAYRAVEIETRPYPGFPTDMHPPIMPLLALARGESRLRETVFEDRFAYVDELRRMGADIRLWGQTAIVRGVAGLRGDEVQAGDIRAGVALVLAGLAAYGTTIVHDDEGHVPRGYSDLAGTLRELGADVQIIE
jgi:UDP-N-acetylglucosamine 1-carboxyvinyltransferase